jgi:hypothetical protein
VKILKLQDAMEWQPFLQGALALDWSEHMDLYYNAISQEQHKSSSMVIIYYQKIMEHCLGSVEASK